MKRRVVAGLSAVLLAVVGAALLLSYVGGADQRAMAGMQTVRVLVVTKAVPQGTAAGELAPLVTDKLLPAVAVAPGAVSDVGELAGKVATTDLQPGEQLLAGRFAAASTLPNADQVRIPAGLQEISVALDPQRVIGGHLVAGARVGVFLSMPKDGDTPAQTRLLLEKVLVSRVETGDTLTPTVGKSTTSGSGGGIMVTFAVSGPDAEKLVFAAENGTLWLTRQSGRTVGSSLGVLTAGNVDQ